MMMFRQPIVRFILGIISLILCVGLVQSLYSQIRREDAVGERKQGYLREQKRNIQLKESLKQATGSAYIEKIAREKLGLVKEGDTVILLDTSKLKDASRLDTQVGESNWAKWVRLFF